MTPNEWLQSTEQPYDAGRQLYEQLGKNAVLKRRLAAGPNAYNWQALRWELKKLAEAGVVVPAFVVTPVVTANVPAPEAAPAENPLVAELKQQARPLYDRRSWLHAQLEHGSEAERVPLLTEVLALSRQLDTHFETLAYMREHGQLPVPAPVMPAFDVEAADLATLIDRRANLRSNISKWKKRADRTAELQQAEAERDVLDARIKALKGKEAGRGK